MALLLGAALALIPLLIAPGFFFYFDITPKILVLVFSAAVALPCFIAAGWKAVRELPRPFLLLLCGSFLAVAIAAIWSPNPDLSLSGTNWRRLGLVTWTAILLFTLVTAAYLRLRPERFLHLLRFIVAGGLLVAAYGVAQFFGWDPFLPAAAYHVGEYPATIVRPPGTLGHAAYFAAYLLNVVFAGLALAELDSLRFWRAAGWAAAASGTFAIVLSGTRAAILGLAAGAAFLAIRRGRRIPIRKLLLGALAAGAAFLAFYVSPAALQLRNRTQWYREDPLGGGRLWLWRDTLRLSESRFPFGAGLETFSFAFPRFESKELAGKYPDFYYESPHNMFLDALAEQGIAGLAVLVLLIAWGFQAAARARRKQPRMAVLLAAWLLAGIVAHQFACFTAATALFFFVNLALIASLVGEAPPRPGNPRKILAAAALPISLALFVFGARLLMADRALLRTDENLRAFEIPAALRDYERFDWWRPPGMNADLWFSRSLANAALKNPDLRVRLTAGRTALEAARDAAAGSEERHNALYNLAMLSAAAGDARATEESLRLAIAAAPNWYKPHLALARLLLAGGRGPEALAEARMAASLSGGNNKAAADTLQSIAAQARAGEDHSR